ncbi:hypothetical protein, partial [Staphylococcus aureus]|uniref:hypothetical protein n=1 Tax=Staphylococcus aureus TaxID=1280 RepID=UPI001F413FE0
RRARQAARGDLDRTGAGVAMLGADVRRCCARLPPADAEDPPSKTRPPGERGNRTLDALIARFDRRF